MHELNMHSGGSPCRETSTEYTFDLASFHKDNRWRIFEWSMTVLGRFGSPGEEGVVRPTAFALFSIWSLI